MSRHRRGNGSTVGVSLLAVCLCLAASAGGAHAAPPASADRGQILTPKPGPAPRVNGPTVYGCRPGNPFLYRIPATGQRPMTFAVENLPGGLSVDPQTGIITGTVAQRGQYVATLKASNARGAASRKFKIVCGDTLSLTPSMGWNHWYAHYNRVTDKLMRQAADAMVASGMADVGYQYVSIDDCWMNAPRHADPLRVGPLRDGRGNVLPNKHFPDMKALTDYIQIGYVGKAHGMGEPRPCPLASAEQYAFMSLWCLMAAPLFYSGDMNRLDELTLSVLTNPEVIEVDQDPLGHSARVVHLSKQAFAMVKDLEDGGKAVGLFNRGQTAATVAASWTQLGLAGKHRVRDLWRQEDLDAAPTELKASLPRHGVLLVRLSTLP